MDDIVWYTPEEEKEKKAAYARALMRTPMFPEKAAMAVETRSAHVSYILTHWQFDREINEMMDAMWKDEGPKAAIPSKEEFASALYRDANACRDSETKLDYYKLFASVMGYIEKPSGVTVNQNNTLNAVKTNVLVLPERKSPEEIEQGLMDRQQKLIERARTLA